MIQQTSLEAYQSVPLQRREKQVLDVIKQIQPCSNRDIAKFLGWEINSITGRTNGLCSKGVVIEFDKQVQNGRKVIRWVCADKQLGLF